VNHEKIPSQGDLRYIESLYAAVRKEIVAEIHIKAIRYGKKTPGVLLHIDAIETHNHEDTDALHDRLCFARTKYRLEFPTDVEEWFYGRIPF